MAPTDFFLGPVKCSTHTVPQLLDEIRLLRAETTLTPRTIACVNAHIFNVVYRDGEARELLNACRIVGADGMAIVWAARVLGAPLRERCNMTQAFHAFLADERMQPGRALLLGCSLAEAEAAASRIQAVSRHCRILLAADGFRAVPEYRALLQDADNPDFVFVGMGTPKSERVIALASQACPRAVVWHIGAGTIRYYAGATQEAPLAIQQMGLQWMHRLWAEPGRMWKRYLIGNPLFVLRMFRFAMRRKPNPSAP